MALGDWIRRNQGEGSTFEEPRLIGQDQGIWLVYISSFIRRKRMRVL